MAYILHDGEYHDEIRSMMGLSEQILSNKDIDNPTGAPIAEYIVMETVPEYESLTMPDNHFLYVATLNLVCAYLCPSMKTKYKERERSMSGYEYYKQRVDWGSRARDYENEYLNWLSRITQVDISLFNAKNKIFRKAQSKYRTEIENKPII